MYFSLLVYYYGLMGTGCDTNSVVVGTLVVFSETAVFQDFKILFFAV